MVDGALLSQQFTMVSGEVDRTQPVCGFRDHFLVIRIEPYRAAGADAEQIVGPALQPAQ